MYPVTLAAVLAFVAIDAIADIQVPMWQYNRTKVYNPGAEAEVLNIINGSQDKCSFNQNGIPVFDFGGLKTLTRLRIAPGMTTDYWRFNYGANLSFEVSSDAKTWVEAHNLGTGYAETGFYDVSLEGLSGQYRYVRLKSPGGTRGCGEMQLYTDDMTLTLAPAKTWVNATAPMSAESSDGVCLSGVVGRIDDALVTVWAYVAATDYDNDRAAWAANGQAFKLAELSGSGEYSGFVTGFKNVKNGFYYVRTFADSGVETTASHMTRTFVVGTKPAPTVKAYFDCNKTGTSNAPVSIYVDGVVNTKRAEVNAATANLVFDLKDIYAQNRYVASVRIWPNTISSSGGCRPRVLPTMAYLAYDNEEPVTWKSSEKCLDTATRKLDYVATGDWPTLTWKSAANWVGFFGYTGQDIMEMPISREVIADMMKVKRDTGALPRYLKIYNGQKFDVLEVELRTRPFQNGLAVVIE